MTVQNMYDSNIMNDMKTGFTSVVRGDGLLVYNGTFGNPTNFTDGTPAEYPQELLNADIVKTYIDDTKRLIFVLTREDMEQIYDVLKPRNR